MAHLILFLLLLSGLTGCVLTVVYGLWRFVKWLGIEKPALDETENGVLDSIQYLEGRVGGVIVSHNHTYGSKCNERCGEITADTFDVSQSDRRLVSRNGGTDVSYFGGDSVTQNDDDSVTPPPVIMDADFVCAHDDPSWCDDSCRSDYGFEPNSLKDVFTECAHGIPWSEPCELCELDDDNATEDERELTDYECDHGLPYDDDCLDCWYDDMSAIEPITIDHNMPEAWQEYQRSLNLTLWCQARSRHGV